MALPFQPSALALILASKGIGPYFRQHFLDKTFQGLYQVNAFDLALLIPYFIVLIILAAYGGHRYWLVYLSPRIRSTARSFSSSSTKPNVRARASLSLKVSRLTAISIS